MKKPAQTSNPESTLFQNARMLPILPVCEHIAGTPTFLRKAFSLQKKLHNRFDITCDLEDGSPAENLMQHAESLLATLTEHELSNTRLGIRFPHYSHTNFQSLLELFISTLKDSIRYITLPKINTADELNKIITAITMIEKSAAVTNPIPLHILIETNEALRQLDTIAANSRVECLDFGIMDFISEHLGGIPSACMHSPGQFDHELLRHAKTSIVHAAFSHSCVASHNVTIAYNDVRQTYEDALTAKNRFGFSRMWSIHPAQIEPILNALTPDFSNIALSQRIIELGASAQWSPIAMEGILYDRASFRYHWQLCKQAYALGIMLNPDFVATFFSRQ
jgi:citrate lyase subunit beta / citryl-CoA lyase